MSIVRLSDCQVIEVRGFKWPRRATAVAQAYLLGEDAFGRWLGVRKGSPWQAADGSSAGVFASSFIKLVPHATFWSVCFHPVDPVVDVDIILPARWAEHVLEEVDLELDILRSAEGKVWVRDQDTFERMREERAIPEDIVAQATATCEQVRLRVEQGVEPFGSFGHAWLSRFLAAVDADAAEPGARGELAAVLPA